MSKTIRLAEASKAQMRHFAETHLGIAIHPNANEETVRAKVAAAWNRDEIEVPDEPAPAPQEGSAPRPVTAAQKPPEKGKVRVLIAKTEEPGGEDDVPISVNGRAMLVPRGREVEIPAHYFEVLRNAVRTVYDSLPDGGMVPREVPRYAFQRVA